MQTSRLGNTTLHWLLAAGLVLGLAPGLRADLVTRLPFDGDLLDVGPGGNDGTYAPGSGDGTIPFVEGRDGTPDGAILLTDGVGDYVRLTPTTKLPITANPAFTVAMWVNGAVQNDKRVFSESNSSGLNNPLFNIGVRNTPAVNIYYRNDSGATVYGGNGHRTASRVAFDESWHHIAWSDDNGTVTLYVDGVADPTDYNYDRSLVTLSADTTIIGAILRGSVCCEFSGAIDDVQLFDHALNLEEVRAVIEDGECPEVGDTTCSGLEITTPPEGGIGTYTATASATDDSGDTELIYTFTAENADDGAVLTVGPQGEPTADFLLTVGTWTISVDIDDDAFCFDTSEGSSCSSEPIVIDPPPELISHWKLDGDLLDSQDAMNDGVMVPAGSVPAFTEGFDGTPDGAILLDGTSLVSAVHNRGLPIFASPEFTVALFVKGPPPNPDDPDNPIATDRRVFSESSSVDRGPLFNIGTSTEALSSKMMGFVRVGSTQLNHPPTDRDAFDSEWHHIAWVDRNGEVTIYIDGVRDAGTPGFQYERPLPSMDITTIGGILRTSGGNPDPGFFFTGAIDDVRVYNYALTDEEVRGIIPEPGTCPGDGGDTSVDDLAIAGPEGGVFGLYTVTVTASDVSGDPISYLVTAESEDGTLLQQGPGPESVAEFELLPGVWTITATVDDDLFCRDALETATRSESITVLEEPPILVAHIAFDGDFLDSSGNGNNGSIVGAGDVTFDDGYDCNPAAVFDGTNFIQLAHTAELPIYAKPKFSIAMWVKGMPQQDNRVYSESSTASNTPLFNIGTDNDGVTGVVDLFIRGDSNPLNHVKSQGIAFDGSWHHIVWTDDNGNAALYIDGVKDATDFTYTRPVLEANITTIGGILRGSACCQYTGSIDEVRLYNYILGEDEILDLVGDGPAESCCPETPDTTCSGVDLTDAPAGNRPGDYTFTANAEDASGDPILHEFTATKAGGEPITLPVQESASATFTLDEGVWTISATVFEDSDCRGEEFEDVCSTEVTVKPPCPTEGDTVCEVLNVIGPAGPRNVPGTYTATATAIDDSGDPIRTTFTADNGVDDPMIQEVEGVSTTFELTEGTWTISATVDDDPECDDAAPAAICEPRMVTVLPPCPEASDTRVDTFDLSGPDGDIPGDYTANATATDDSGDTVLYTFTFDNGVDDPTVVGPQEDSSATETLDVGDWTISVFVDDDLDCPDEDGGNSSVLEISIVPPGGGQLPGDSSQDGTLDTTDTVTLLGFLFLGDPTSLPCGDGSQDDPGNKGLVDSNGDGVIDISDAVYDLAYGFLGGPPPANGTDCIRLIGCEELCTPVR